MLVSDFLNILQDSLIDWKLQKSKKGISYYKNFVTSSSLAKLKVSCDSESVFQV